MVSFIQTADLHLGAGFGFLGEKSIQKQKLQLQVWNNIIETCINENVDFLLISGDLFDSNKIDNSILDEVCSGLRLLKEKKIETVIIPGTHDPYIGGRGVLGDPRIFTNAKILTESRIQYKFKNKAGEDIIIYGFGYEAEQSAQNVLDKIKRESAKGIHVGVLHCSVIQNPDWNYRSIDFPISTEMLADLNLDYIALGHYHDFKKIFHKEKLVAAYSGTPEGVKTSEIGTKYILKVEIQSKENIQIKEIKSNLIEFKNNELNISSNEEFDAFITDNSEPETIMKLIVKGFAINLKTPEKHGYFYLNIDDKTMPYNINEVCQRICSEKTIRGEFARMMVEGMKGDKKELFQEALKEVLIRLGEV